MTGCFLKGSQIRHRIANLQGIIPFFCVTL